MKRKPMLDSALEYLEHGWSIVPLGKDKVPLVKWKEFQSRLATEKEVRAWWKRWPDANIAILTGHLTGMVVVDVDTHKGGDVAAWRERCPSTMEVETPKGGRHFYYAHPGEGNVVRNSVEKLAPGVDVRGDGGYVMAPPSVRDDGRGYEWHGTMRRLPLWEDVPEPKPVVDVGGERWLERLLAGVGSGERNDACARLAGYFAGKGMPVDVVVSQLLAWNKQNRPPMPESEVRTTVESVWRTERDRKARPTSSLEEGHGAYDLIRLDEYVAKHGGNQTNWLVKDWLPQQTVGMVVAPPGSYKTWLLQDLAVSVSSGLPFLGQFPVERPGPVLFMQQEDWHGQTAHRFALIVGRRAGLDIPRFENGKFCVDVHPKLPIYLHEHRGFRFGDKGVIEAWLAAVQKLRPSLVILDPLYSAGSVEDFMAGTARDMFLFKSVRDALGTTFLIAHHTRKRAGMEKLAAGNDAVPEREDVWGSQFLNAWLETGWQIRKREEVGTASIARHFKVQSDAHRAILGFDIDTTVSPGKYEVAIKEIKPGDKKAEKDVDLVEMLDKVGPMTTAALVERTGLDRTTIFRRMDNLRKAGEVVQDKGKWATSTGGLDA